MRTFYFSPKNCADCTICNKAGKCCVLGQFALQFGDVTKKQLKKDGNAAYDIADQKLNDSWTKFTSINDDDDLKWSEKIKQLRELFNKNNYKMVVTKEEMKWVRTKDQKKKMA